MAWCLGILLGLVLLAIEMLTPGGFVMAFFGSAALVVGILVGAGLGGPMWLQWILFSVLSVGSMLLRGQVQQWLRALVLPATVSDVGSMIALAMNVINRSAPAPSPTGRRAPPTTSSDEGLSNV